MGKPIAELIPELGLNEAIEMVMFSEDYGNLPFVKRKIKEYKGKKMPYLWLVLKKIDSYAQKHFIQPGVDYQRFNKKMMEIREISIKEDQEKQEQEQATRIAEQQAQLAQEA